MYLWCLWKCTVSILKLMLDFGIGFGLVHLQRSVYLLV